MKLEPNEAFLFFKLMLPLQFFVNQNLGILEGIETFQDYKNASFQEKFKVRNALFDNIHLIDAFIDENPSDIPLKELAVVSAWKRFVVGEFYIERHLKTHTIFIGADDKVYAVVGLTSSLEEIFPNYLIPQITAAILLPFQDKIVSDGFFAANQIFIGNNIKKELKEVYNKAKKKDKIIQTL
jgi:hypothetical protein